MANSWMYPKLSGSMTLTMMSPWPWRWDPWQSHISFLWQCSIPLSPRSLQLHADLLALLVRLQKWPIPIMPWPSSLNRAMTQLAIHIAMPTKLHPGMRKRPQNLTPPTLKMRNPLIRALHIRKWRHLAMLIVRYVCATLIGYLFDTLQRPWDRSPRKNAQLIFGQFSWKLGRSVIRT